MKGWSKRLLACGAALVVTASAVCFGYTVPEAAAQGDDTLGAENACTGHKLGEINGLPACVNSHGDLHICENNFPDKSFRDYLLEIDEGKDNFFTEEENKTILTIDVASKKILTLSGVEFFPYLTKLNCASNQLTELNVSKNTILKTLHCFWNKLTELDVSYNKQLTTLECNGNELEQLNVENNTLLIKLICWDNQLTNLDVSKNTALKIFWCGMNQLQELDVSNNLNLSELSCNSNRISFLNVSNNLQLATLICSSNCLSSLNVAGNTNLTLLECQNQKITAELFESGDMWTTDFGRFISSKDFNLIHTISPGDYDSKTGIVTFSLPETSFSYKYFTGRLNVSMPVTVQLTTHIHSFGDWEMVESPTCTDKGSEKRVCEDCGFTETRDLDAAGHDWEEAYTVDKEPTCTTEGAESIHCANCEAVKDSRTLAALGHDYEESVTKEPTCTEPGEKTFVCRHDASHTYTEEIPALGHDFSEEWTIDKAPTETEPGSQSHHCLRCGEKADVTAIPATGPAEDSENPQTGSSMIGLTAATAAMAGLAACILLVFVRVRTSRKPKHAKSRRAR